MVYFLINKKFVIKSSVVLAISLFIISYGCNKPRVQHPDNLIDNIEFQKGNPGALLVKEMIDSLGGLAAYRALIDVEYTYTYRDAEGMQDVSLERYIYDGEKSWARYEEHTKNVFPNDPGIVIQGFDGKVTWLTKEGEVMSDERIIASADFMRKTNFYWFNMMFKLLDPGLNYEVQDPVKFNETGYYIVKITFGKNIGDAQDIYVLFINQESGLVDRFLFTVMDFGRSDPLLMEVKYEEYGGLKWPVYRRYTASNWSAELSENSVWVEEISTNISFDQGIDPQIFSAPVE